MWNTYVDGFAILNYCIYIILISRCRTCATKKMYLSQTAEENFESVGFAFGTIGVNKNGPRSKLPNVCVCTFVFARVWEVQLMLLGQDSDKLRRWLWMQVDVVNKWAAMSPRASQRIGRVSESVSRPKNVHFYHKRWPLCRKIYTRSGRFFAFLSRGPFCFAVSRFLFVKGQLGHGQTDGRTVDERTFLAKFTTFVANLLSPPHNETDALYLSIYPSICVICSNASACQCNGDFVSARRFHLALLIGWIEGEKSKIFPISDKVAS